MQHKVARNSHFQFVIVAEFVIQNIEKNAISTRQETILLSLNQLMTHFFTSNKVAQNSHRLASFRRICEKQIAKHRETRYCNSPGNDTAFVKPVNDSFFFIPYTKTQLTMLFKVLANKTKGPHLANRKSQKIKILLFLILCGNPKNHKLRTLACRKRTHANTDYWLYWNPNLLKLKLGQLKLSWLSPYFLT